MSESEVVAVLPSRVVVGQFESVGFGHRLLSLLKLRLSIGSVVETCLVVQMFGARRFYRSVFYLRNVVRPVVFSQIMQKNKGRRFRSGLF